MVLVGQRYNVSPSHFYTSLHAERIVRVVKDLDGVRSWRRWHKQHSICWRHLSEQKCLPRLSVSQEKNQCVMISTSADIPKCLIAVVVIIIIIIIIPERSNFVSIGQTTSLLMNDCRLFYRTSNWWSVGIISIAVSELWSNLIQRLLLTAESVVTVTLSQHSS